MTFERERQHMVVRQLRARGIADAQVLAAMTEVPREHFVDADWRRDAYADQPLPIGAGQTISQPYIVARTAELAELEPTDRVLDVGVGSGYQSAVLARLASAVYGVEIRRELGLAAAVRLAELGVDRVELRVGDGGYGWPEHAPYDAVVVAAAARTAPAPLVAQLGDGGRMIIPIGDADRQELVRIIRRGDEFVRESHGPVRFVAFMGDYGDRLAPTHN